MLALPSFDSCMKGALVRPLYLLVYASSGGSNEALSTILIGTIALVTTVAIMVVIARKY